MAHCEGFRRWWAKIRVNKKELHLGSFHSEEQAARAYDACARFYFGEFAKTNFIGDERYDAQESKRRSRIDRGGSRYFGVSWDTRRGKWMVRIHSPKKPVSKSFAVEVEAAKYYDAVVKNAGLDLPLNFG